MIGPDEEQLARMMELRDEVASTCMSSQTESTLMLDMSSEPIKAAEIPLIEKVLRRVASHKEEKAAKGSDEIAWLSLQIANRQNIGAANGIKIILSSMQRWMGKRAIIIENCLAALSRLLTDDGNLDEFYEFENTLINRLTEERNYNGGGTILISAALTGYPLRVTLQQFGCTVVKAVIRSDLYLIRFLENGLLGNILAAMHRHSDVPVLLVECCEAISDLARQPKIGLYMVQQGATLDYVSEALQLHIENSAIVTAAATFLENLQQESSERDSLLLEIRKSTAIPTILEAMEIHSGNPTVTALLIDIIEPHISFFPSRIDQIANCIKKIMSTNYDVDVLTQCCRLIEILGPSCPNDITRVRVGKHVVPYIAAAMQAFSDEPELLFVANAALTTLVVNKFSTDLHRPRRGYSGRVVRPSPPPVRYPYLLMLKSAATTKPKTSWELLAQ
eukprot:TRINITY_DN3472_c0_g1_i1.p1 TRINITY_DN3472_c0_g1~~TRINITY_DN3472_c0_g1_i1.p1  ORF type:complete len:448 (+),score=86.23 TRINITY_DN3472_c0_g1_i1:43-1386(+)